MLSENLFNFLTKTLRVSFKYQQKTFEHEGGRLFYLHYEQEKPTLVLIHGFSDIPENLIRSTYYLRKRFNIILPALKGFDQEGVSTDVDYSIDLYAEQVLALLESLGVDHFIVGGNSLGGATSLKIYEKAPEKVKKLILMDSAGFEFENVDTVIQKIKKGGANPFLIDSQSDFDELFRQLFYRVPKETFPVKKYFYQKYKKGKSDYLHLSEKLFAENHDRDFIIKPEDLKVPTSIIWGEEDFFFPPQVAKLIHAKAPQSSLEMIPRVGHLPHIESPFKLARILDRLV